MNAEKKLLKPSGPNFLCRSAFTKKSDLSFRMTLVKVNKLRFIWDPSFNLAPIACVCAARSLPARSTKFYKQSKKPNR